MGKSRRSEAGNANPLAADSDRLASRCRELEPLRPLCGCGCGEKLEIPTIARRVSVAYIQRYWQQHPNRQNHYKVPSLAERWTALEPLRPLCSCGCGERLEIPSYMLNRAKPAGIAGIKGHWNRHPYRQGHGIWERRTLHYIENAQPLNSEDLGCIYGTLLGDGAITYPNSSSRFPRLSWTHGLPQRAWMEHKASRLDMLRPCLRIATNQGYGEFSVSCSTACHPQLCEVFSIVRPDGAEKRISPEWLAQITPAGLAWWYMDDGSLRLTPEGSPQIRLHTEGYSAEENQLLAAWLTELGYPTQVKTYSRKQSRYFYLTLGATSARSWLADLCQYSIPSMAYKFGEGRICPPRWG